VKCLNKLHTFFLFTHHDYDNIIKYTSVSELIKNERTVIYGTDDILIFDGFIVFVSFIWFLAKKLYVKNGYKNTIKLKIIYID